MFVFEISLLLYVYEWAMFGLTVEIELLMINRMSSLALFGYPFEETVTVYVMKWILKMIGLLMVSKASVSHDLPSPGWNSPVMLLSFVDAWNRPF